jgi:HSP20 family protein
MAWELVNTNPFREIEKVRSEMDKLWDTFLWGRPRKRGSEGEEEWLPAVDVTETKNDIIVNCEISGMDPKDLEISLSDGTLTIRGEKKQEKEESEENYQLLERNYGSFIRLIPIPKEVESDKISASYKDGVLKVTLPKSAKTKKKEIKIKVE